MFEIGMFWNVNGVTTIAVFILSHATITDRHKGDMDEKKNRHWLSSAERKSLRNIKTILKSSKNNMPKSESSDKLADNLDWWLWSARHAVNVRCYYPFCENTDNNNRHSQRSKYLNSTDVIY